MTRKNKKTRVSVASLLLWLAAAFAAYNFGLAGGYIEGRPQGQVSAGGLIAGVVVNLSLAVSASRLGSVRGKARARQARWSLAALLALSPLIVSPVVYYALPETFLPPVLRALWAIGWPLAADVAIVAAGSVTGRSLISLESDGERRSSVANSRSERRSAKKSVAQSRSSVAPASLSASESEPSAKIYRCERCGFETANRYRYSGHKTQCKLIPVDDTIFDGGER